MKKLILLLIALSFTLGVKAQLQSQLNYCRSEVERLETEITKYKSLLEIQNKDLRELKIKQVELDRQLKQLEHEKSEANKLSIELMTLALKYEEREKYHEAMDIYRMLIKNYPKSLEAASSKIKVADIKHAHNKQNKKK